MEKEVEKGLRDKREEETKKDDTEQEPIKGGAKIQMDAPLAQEEANQKMEQG